MSHLTQMIITKALLSVIAVSGVYVLTGLTGMFSLGQAAYMSVGAYTAGILVVRFGVPFPLAVVIAIAVAVMIALVVSIPTVKLKRDYISLVSLGFGEALTAILNKMTNYTGGSSGFYGIPQKVSVLGVVVSAIIVIVLVVFFKKSKYGRQCLAVKCDELAAKAMGINVEKIKMIALLFSAAVTAFSGSLYAFYITYIDPSLFGWKRSAEWIIMVFFGGVNSLTGSVLASFFLTALPEALRNFSSYRYMVYAVIVLLIINFKPSGVLGEFELSVSGIKGLYSKIKEKTQKISKKEAR